MVDSPVDSTSSGSTPTEPTVASSTSVPPLTSSVNEGGEWELLLTKVQNWFASGQAAALWQQSRTPVLVVAVVVAVAMLLQVYGALINAIDSLPLLPGLLELVGVIWVLQQGLPRLLRSSDRQQLMGGLRQRWQAFRGS